jgi:hypothetical protein
MKSHITVLLTDVSKGLSTTFEELMQTHKLDEDDETSFTRHHWDYWFFYNKWGTQRSLVDPEIIKKFPLENPSLLENACLVKNIPDDFTTSGIIVQNEEWYDLQDFGWAMLNEPSPSNVTALEKWNKRARDIFDKNTNAIAIQVITHC